MKTVLAVFDGFFDLPRTISERVLGGTFEDFVSPWDGVTYPGINKDLPVDVVAQVIKRLEDVTGEDVHPVAVFARVTSSATGAAPHRIHSDRVMAQYSAHIYLSSEWPESAGTAFWNHKTEGPMHTDETDVEQITADTHLPNAWDKVFAVQGRFNRMVIHDSRLWHSAEPAGGWGDTPADGRVVLTCFFNTKERPA